ncbi:hypothetical protein [Nitrosophilus alvini]|uniref:hypothetical protein n=1 Tax=Nitrosophilus alvini TaxID=2714855 RepID=UPI00190D7548|nr:hypothetical protein [Nitrosophilus alvini]
MIKSWLFAVCAVFLLWGCAAKMPQQVKSSLIVMKTPKLRFADTGFVKKYKNRVEVEIYSAGSALLGLSISNRVCTDEGCMSKKEFNKKYLSAHYPPDLLKNVFLGRPIFKAENIFKSEDGFEQHIYKKNSFDIIYRVKKGEIYFKDRINRILIKVKDI